MVDLVIQGGKIVTAQHTTPPAWIAVDGGRIVAIGTNKSWPEAKQTIDASGKYILPGVVDPENHPIPPIEEGFITETRAAVASGITTTGMMLSSSHTTKVPKPIHKREDIPLFMEGTPAFIELGNQCSMTDFFFTPEMSTENQVKEIPELAEKLGVTSFKLYLHCKTGEHIWDMWPIMEPSGMFYYDDGMIYRAMRSIAALGPPVILCLHCENWEIARVNKEALVAQGRTDPGAWDDCSPAFCEAGHVHNYTYYAKVTGCPVHIMHTTTRETVEEVAKAKKDGVNVTANVQPHYLTLTKDKGLINVPLRSGADFEILWEAIRTGVIDTISSDHIWIGISLEEVEKHGMAYPYNIWTRWQTFGGTAEASLAIILSEGVSKGRISLERLVEVCCENNARRFGLYPKKGTIAIGSDADFAIVDLNKTKILTRDMLHTRIGWSLYEGWEIKGWPVMTILRGKVVMEWPEGEPRPKIVGEPIGQYIPRKPGHELYPLS